MKSRHTDRIDAPHSARHPVARKPRLTRPLLGAAGIIFLIYALYQIVERMWLGGLDMRTLHLAHMIRGIVSSLAAAAVAGWMITRHLPVFLEASPYGEKGIRRRRLTESERMKIYARWFIAMRWIAVLIAGVLVFLTVRVARFLPLDLFWPLGLMVCTLAGFNFIYAALVRRNRKVSTLLVIQAYIDIAILVVLLHFSGGVENPLFMILIFHVIIGGILLSRGHCYGIAAAGSILFSLLIWAEWSGALEHYTLQLFPHVHNEEGEILHAAHYLPYVATRALLQTLILFLTAYFVTTLADRLRYNERRLEEMADQALADRQLLERALETTGTCLCVRNRDLSFYWANNLWNEWHQATTEVSSSAPTPRETPPVAAAQSIQDGRIRMTEITVNAPGTPSSDAHSGAGRRVFQVTTAPLMDARGEIHQVVELAQDITERKHIQEQIIRAGELAAVGELAGHVAHEVNNPIAILCAKASLLLSDRRNEMSDVVARELQKIHDQARRVARIAQGLLSYCRPSAATRSRMDIRVPIRKSLAMVKQTAETGGVRIEDMLPGKLPPVIANPSEVEQVFLNLFLNAMDAMPEGGSLRVTAAPEPVRLPNGRRAVAVRVEDTGTGIPKTIRERIFEPFFTTKTEGKGTGLGLSICSGLIRSHCGELSVEEKSGSGTRFVVKLPCDEPGRSEEDPA